MYDIYNILCKNVFCKLMYLELNYKYSKTKVYDTRLQIKEQFKIRYF